MRIKGYFVIVQYKGRICLRMGSTEQERCQDRELKNNLWALNLAAWAAILPVDFSTRGEPMNNLFCLRHSLLGFLLLAIRESYYCCLLSCREHDPPLRIHSLLPKGTSIFTQLSLLSYSAHVSRGNWPHQSELGSKSIRAFFHHWRSGSGKSIWLIRINTKTV